MSQLYTPFLHDFVGSFLRPEQLRQARQQYQNGTITRLQLTEIEDTCIRDLVQKEKALGFQAITDGEFRRQAWHLDFMWGFDGVGHHTTKNGLPFVGEQAMIDDTYLTGRIHLEGTHPFVEHFRFMKQFEDEKTIVKQTIPAPAQFLAQMWMPFARSCSAQYYSSVEDLCRDLINAYHTVIHQFYDAGCRNLQFDDCTWGMIVDPDAPHFFGTDRKGLEDIKHIHLELNNACIEGHPSDMVINTHVCRGNYHSTFANRGAYTAVSRTLFAKENVNAFYLEFDDARSGGFEPLADVSGDKKVVLGLITTKSPTLENKESIKERIIAAARYIPLERLCLSPQCGFASCEIGNKLTEEQQWAKLRLVKEIAEEVWPQ